MSGDTIVGPFSLISPMVTSTLTFNGGNSEPWLTISQDGVMKIGAGLSEDEATRRVAELLASHYSQLHREQAAEIERLKGLLASGASS